MDNSNIKIIFTALVFMLVSAGSVFAFGISSPYWNDNPLKMYPGQTKDISFNLQNCPGFLESCDGEDANVVLSLLEGSEIAQITSGANYLVPYGTADTYIDLRVSIPDSARIGDSYNVRFSVASPPDEEGGNVQLGVKYNVDFPVKVVSQGEVTGPAGPGGLPKETGGTWKVVLWIIAIIIIIIIIYWFIRKKRQV